MPPPADPAVNHVLKRFTRAGSAGRWHALYSEDDATVEGLHMRLRRDRAVAEVMARVGPQTRVLDLGCGAGPVLAELRRRGVLVTGVDSAPDMLEFARLRLRTLGLPTSDLLQADVRHVPLAAGSIDCIICLGVVSYMRDRRELLREIRRLLRPGGLLLLSFRSATHPLLCDPWRALRHLLRGLGDVLLGTPAARRTGAAGFIPGQFLRRGDVARELTQAGFALEAEIGIGFGPLRLGRRHLLSEGASMRLSRGVTELLARPGLCRLAPALTDVQLGIWRLPA